ncbi:MAG: polysaccharide chain length determinant, locus subfamily protein, partial [Massilia sp.]|nr:polysaccharide chain length determinant, locus subfamily protein [Massilia sp.]
MEELITQLLSSVRGIWKDRWLAVAVMWLVGFAGWTRVATLPDVYQSSARVFVDTQS